MLSLTLNDEERNLLEDILREAISDLRMEIADTDSHDYRMGLHRREDVLKQLVARLVVDPQSQPM